MTDSISPYNRHYIMSRIQAKNTKPELKLRHALWHHGFRYKLYDKNLPGRPDIVLPKYRTVVFIHGCFWHGHKGCSKYNIPKTNTDFWIEKVIKNQERDQRIWRELEAQGWRVIIVWECDLSKTKVESTINFVEQEIRSAGEQHKRLQKDRQEERKRYRAQNSESLAKRQQMKKELSRF